LSQRKAQGLPKVEHKPNYILAAALFPQRDPWQADNLTEEEAETIKSNCLQDGGQAMPEGIDMIDYYKDRMAVLYQAGFVRWVQKLMEDPDPAEQEEEAEV
jgi:hypothetical protein